MDDTSEPIVSAFFLVLDVILFLGMVTGAVLMMRVGNQVNDNSKHGMSDRDILTAQAFDDEKNRYLTDERDYTGARAVDSAVADINSPSTAYDGMLTGEEVINAVLAMRHYHDAYANPAQTYSHGAYFDAATGEICPKAVIVTNGSQRDLGATVPAGASNMCAITYAQEYNVGALTAYISTDPGYLYKRTYTVYDDGSGNPDQKALQMQITYTRVNR